MSYCSLYRIICGTMGVSPKYFLDEMSGPEINLLLEGYRVKRYDSYKVCQLLMYAVCQSQSTKKLTPEKVLPLKEWEKDLDFDAEDFESVVEEREDVNDLREKMLNTARNIARQKRGED